MVLAVLVIWTPEWLRFLEQTYLVVFGLLLLAAIATIPIDMQPEVPASSDLSWQLQAHILIAMFAFFVGAGVWAFWPSQRSARLDAAQIPFRDDPGEHVKHCRDCGYKYDDWEGSKDG